MSKINLFSGNKDKVEAVSKYVYNHANKKALSLQYSELIKEQRVVLESWSKLDGSTMAKTAEDKLAQMKVIEALEAERDAKCDEFAYVSTEADRKLKKYAKTPHTRAELADAIRTWFKQFGLEVDDTTFIGEIIASAGDKVDWKLFDATDGKALTRFNENNLLKMCYFKTYEKMVACGLVKAETVPAPMRDYYNKKKAEAEAKKAAKKANK